MWSVIASALAARRGQAVIVAVIAMLATAATAAAPWYAVAATHQVAVDTLAGAPTAERLIEVSLRGDEEGRADDPIDAARAIFSPPGFTAVAGGEAGGRWVGGASDGSDVSLTLAYREDVCEYLALVGRCPEAADEVVVRASFAQSAGLEIGEEITVERAGAELGTVRVVGHYEPIDAADRYWGNGQLIGAGARGAHKEAAFLSRDALGQLGQVTYTYDLVADPEAVAVTDIDELDVLVADGVTALRAQGFSVTTREITGVVERIREDRRNVGFGIGVGVAVLLLLTWFTLGVVLRGTVTQLRGDLGWWRLHGAPSGRGALASLGQSVVPLLGGAVLGAPAGVLLARAVAGTSPDAAATRLATDLTLILVGVVVAGGMVAVVTTQVGTLRMPVRDLLRRVPARSRRWQRSLLDLLVVLVAAGAVGQALLVGRDAEGVALLAPPLAVLAIALVAAWAVPPLVAAAAARALHSGRLAVALVAVSMARRAGTHRLFALVAVAVALVATGVVGWDTGARTQLQRAALETGADRVLTVQVDDIAQLLAAVRAVDPAGTEAMAVVHRGSGQGQPAMLAVDSTRLGVIAGWRDEYGGTPGQVAAALRPAEPAPAVVTGAEVVLTASATSPDPAPAEPGEPDPEPGEPDADVVYLRLLLRTLDTGEPVEAQVGPLAADRDDYPAAVAACAGSGCRLVGLELQGPPDLSGGHAPPPAGTTVELHGLAVPGGGPVAPDLLADPSRWRPGLGPRDLGPEIAGAGGIRLRAQGPALGGSLVPHHWIYVVDTPLPLPVLPAGWVPALSDELRLAPLPGAEVPVALAGRASLLPVYAGSGVLVDLEYAERMVPDPVTLSTVQVWLSPAARSSIVDDLAAAGVVTVRQESLPAELSRLRSEGSAISVRFQTVVALVGLVLAAGALLVIASQERGGRAAELAALRAQGVRAGVLRWVGYGGQAAAVVAAVLVGLVAGLAGAVLAQLLHPGFVDGWALLPASSHRPYPVGVAALVAVVVLGAAVLAAAVALVRRAGTEGGYS